MTLEEIYFIGQTVAVIALLASVVFVGLQIRQNTKATRAESAYEVYKLWGSLNVEYFQNAEQAQLLSRLLDINVKFEDLNETELARAHFLIRSTILFLTATWLLYKEGSLPREYWEPHRLVFRNIIIIPVAGKIFEMERARGMVTQDFYDELMRGEHSDLDFTILTSPHASSPTSGEQGK